MRRKTSSSPVGARLPRGCIFSVVSSPHLPSDMNLKQFPRMLESKTSCLRITVPENLDLALEGLIRKVLREQPKTDDIYSFAAEYFETLLSIRDKAGPKFAAPQLCPFHNEEDAHEMVRIAGTFAKPSKRNDDPTKTGRKKETQQKKRPKPKRTVKDEKFVKQATPDLIKKLPKVTENLSRVEETKKTDGRKSETIEEIDDEEFLASDPIKELVEKELRMEGKLNGKEEESLKETAVDVEPQNEDKQEEQKDEETDIKPTMNEMLTEEKPIEEEEDNKIEAENQSEEIKQDSEPQNKETPEEITENKDIIESTQKEETTTKSLTETEIIPDETPNASESELQPLQSQEQKDKNEQETTEKPTESPKETAKDDTTPVQNDETPAETSSEMKEEEKITETVVGQETEIDEETAEKDENALEALPVGEDSPLVKPLEVNNSEERETKKGEAETEMTKVTLEEQEKQTDVAEQDKGHEIEKEQQTGSEKIPENTDGADEKGVDEAKSTDEAESQTALETKPPDADKTDERPLEENKKLEISTIENTAVIEPKQENQTEKLESTENKTSEMDKTEENANQMPGEEVMETQNTSEPKPEENPQRKVDSQNIQINDEIEIQNREDIQPESEQNQGKKAEPEELGAVEEKTGNEMLTPEEDIPHGKEEPTNPEELCTVVDINHIPKEEAINEEERKPECETNKEKSEIETPHIIEPEKVQNPEETPEELQIKTIQTHYYDTLQVPETVTKEYIVHNVTTLVGVANALHQNYQQTPTDQTTLDENMNLPLHPTESLENSSISPPPQTPTEVHIENLRSETPPPMDIQNQQDLDSSTQITDSDDLLDIMTPTSGYSLNLSEISWQTISGVFLDSERRFSSLEKGEIKYTTPKSDDRDRPEVEEVIQKTVLPTGMEAVPVPPRDAEEINREANSESMKSKEEDKPEGEGSAEGSSDSMNGDGDVPFISVEVKTVIETQMLDEEDEERDGEQIRRPGVEVKVEATIDIQDEMPQSEPDSTEEGNKISDGKNQEPNDLEEHQSRSQEEQRKESRSTEQTTGIEGSSGESDSTISSAATEIKRSDSSKINFSSTRSLLSTQSLDLGKRNPLLKTRSLSTFRHGVTDFEVWNTIEKELEEAATKIQSKFRGYKTRKKLQRENAVHITTEESSINTTPVEAEAEAKDEGQQSTGEFHDSIVLAEHPR